METKLMAIAIALFAASCGLDTEGVGGSDEGVLPEATDDAGPDIVQEADAEQDAPDEEDAAEDEAGEPDETARDETAEDIHEDISETVEDATEDETADEADGDEADDGGVITPCETPPEVLEPGLFVFYCFADDIRSDMRLWLQIERSGVPITDWSWRMTSCAATDARSILCLVETHYNAMYIFNVQIDPSIGVGWSCGPGLAEPWGTPRAWFDGVELPVEPVTNGDGGCNHSFVTPPSL